MSARLVWRRHLAGTVCYGSSNRALTIVGSLLLHHGEHGRGPILHAPDDAAVGQVTCAGLWPRIGSS